ncbi:hypothetical protein [Providencia rettgeri]|uniref:hypothetical protein n=1 Tax=Providencia rettgeri TaxID=587 RepID=UPI0018C68D1B|nr:hypothetical protein [Providencia rettgeri]MBG5926100.1 hypothetical protein [Providencia rettgeri]
MAKLTKKELAWIEKVQRVLDECPSERLGFYTTGDPMVWIYDRSKEPEVSEWMNKNKGDFCLATKAMDADFFTYIDFPAPVESTAG